MPRLHVFLLYENIFMLLLLLTHFCWTKNSGLRVFPSLVFRDLIVMSRHDLLHFYSVLWPLNFLKL